MKTLITILFVSFSLVGMAQKSVLTIFSEAGDSFTVFANGAKANPQPIASVMVPELAAGKVHVRIAFVKKGVPELNSQINIPADGQLHSLSYKIVRSAKGPYSLVFLADQTSAGATTVASNNSSTEKAQGSDNNKNKKKEANNSANNDPNAQPPGNVSVTMTADDNKFEMNMSQSDNNKKQGNAGNQKKQNEGSVNFNVNMNVSGQQTNEQSNDQSPASPTYKVPQVKDGLMCTGPIPNSQDFVQFKYKVSSTYLDATKVQDSKDYMNKNCLLAAQVADLVKQIQMYDPRLDLAKFGYMHTYDQSNYGVVVDAIVSDYDKEKLLDFIGSYGSNTAMNQSSTTSSNANYTQNTTVTTTTTTNNNQSTNTPPPASSSPSSYSYSSSPCSPMAIDDFEEALEAADEPVGEDAKMSVAKGIFDDACLNTTQIYKIAELFVSEDRRLDFAKFAFSRASDKDKYYKLNKLFINEGRITDLTNYVKQNKNK